MNQKSLSSPTRQYDIDWLRILAVLLLVPFHSALIFVQNPNSIMYVKDVFYSEALDRFAGLVHQFHMPLLFVISGMSSYYALGLRASSQYLRERINRLLIPALFGVIVLIPPVTYLTKLSKGMEQSFWLHYTGFFRINPDELSGISGSFTPAHLWFIIFLFVFSLLALPLFLALRQPASQGALQALGRFFARPGAVFLLALPLTLAAAVDLLGDKNPLYYFLTFFTGYLLATDEGYTTGIQRSAPVALLLGIVFETVRQTVYLDAPDWSLPWLLYGIMENVNRWVWVVAILGFGRRLLNRSGTALRYLSEIAFPFYILHMPFNTLTAYWAVKLPVSVGVKYTVIVLTTTLLTLLASEVVRRVPVLPLLFGMKARKQKPAVPAASQPSPVG